MSTNNKFRNIWYAVFPILTIGAFFLLSNLLADGVSALFLDVLHVPISRFIKLSYLAEALVNAVLLIIFFIVYKAAFKKDVPKYRTAFNAREAVMSVIAGIGVSGVSCLWILLAERIPALSSGLADMDKSNADLGSSTAGVILIAVIFAPLLEELIFRGIVFRSLEKIRAGWFPILISAVVFGIYHMNPVQAVYASGMGIVAAVIYSKTHNLIFPILVHMTNNLISALQSIFPSKAVTSVIDILTVVMILPMCYVLYLMLRRKDTPVIKCSSNDN